MYDIVNLIFI
jgi:hypothetical protein